MRKLSGWLSIAFGLGFWLTVLAIHLSIILYPDNIGLGAGFNGMYAIIGLGVLELISLTAGLADKENIKNRKLSIVGLLITVSFTVWLLYVIYT